MRWLRECDAFFARVILTGPFWNGIDREIDFQTAALCRASGFTF